MARHTGRAYRGDPSKATGGRKGAAAAAKAASSKQKKDRRGPAPLISMPHIPKQDKGKKRAVDREEDDEGESDDGAERRQRRADSDDEDEDEEDDEGLIDAEDMVGDGFSESGSQASDDDGSEEEGAGSTSKAGPSSKPNLSFLTSLDVNAISTSRAEQARLQKAEKKRQRDELKQAARLLNGGKGSGAAASRTHDAEEGESGSEDYEDFADEDDEDLSLGSEDDEELGDDDEDLESLDDDDLDSEELDSDVEGMSGSEGTAASDSDSGSGSDSELDEEAREDARAQRVAAQTKRKRKEEQLEQSKRAKKARLPVRSADGGWVEAEEDGSDSEAASGDAADAAATKRKSRVVRAAAELDDDSDKSDAEGEAARRAAAAASARPTSDVATSTRFGLLAPYAILQLPTRAARVQAAREQIASLAQQIIADPEVQGVGFLKRMAVFMQVRIRMPEHMKDQLAAQPAASGKSKEKAPKGKGKAEEESAFPPSDDEDGSNEDGHGGSTALPVDSGIRAAAIFSLMAVYVDILPGYRIRPLTDAEKEEKVGQEVRRRREFEQGIVEVYRAFLESCEKVIKSKHELSSIALKAMTTLLLRAPHFNYRTNIIRTIVSRLSRPSSAGSWDDECALCTSTLAQLLRQDAAGEVSLEVVRLLHRMIKERRYKVHPNVLDVLLHLRLKDELGKKRASTTAADRSRSGGSAAGDAADASKPDLRHNRKAKAADVRKGTAQRLSKKEVKRMREIKEIEKEMREADATVDLEERERNQTETLKLLFVLYFGILKSPTVSSALLGSAMEGLALYAHRINVDFFRDLLAVLREHTARARKAAAGRQDPREAAAPAAAADGEDEAAGDAQMGARRDLRDALLCLVTAFELLSGQGEALNIDLSDFASHLYAVMLQVSMATDIDEAPTQATHRGAARGASANAKQQHLRSSADLLFRALELLLLRPRASTVPSERAAAFIKRLLGCSLHWSSPTSVVRSLRMIKVLLARDERLVALFDGEDRARDGRFDASGDNVDAVRPLAAGASAWEIDLLRRSVNADVRDEVEQLLVTVADLTR